MIEFKTYNRLISGDLRPYLEKFEGLEGVNSITEEFFSFQIELSNGTNKGIEFPESFYFSDLYSNGSKIEFTIDTEEKKGTLSLPFLPEDELINLDIGLAPDKKGEVFLQLITLELRRAKLSMSKTLNNLVEGFDFRLYINSNYQYLINIGNKLNLEFKASSLTSSKFYSESNYFILSTLKQHIVYSILYIQDDFYSFLDSKILTKHQLEDYLYDGEASKLELKGREFMKSFNRLLKNKVKQECEDNLDYDSSLSCYKTKLKDIDSEIESDIREHGCTNNHRRLTKSLIEDGIKNVLYRKTKSRIDSSVANKSNLEKYIFLNEYLYTLNLSKDFESRFILESELVNELLIDIKHLETLLNIGGENNIDIDVINCLLTLQTRKLHLKSENRKNEYLCDLLRSKKYYVSDESRSGASGSKNAVESGELDIVIRDFKNSGVIQTIIEAFELNSVGPKNRVISNHILKLIDRYDTSGNEENYVVVYSNLSDFDASWESFKKHVTNIVFKEEIIFVDQKSSISKKRKLYTGYHNIPGSNAKVKYFFLEMKST
jgi:hypothetical protein